MNKSDIMELSPEATLTKTLKIKSWKQKKRFEPMLKEAITYM